MGQPQSFDHGGPAAARHSPLPAGDPLDIDLEFRPQLTPHLWQGFKCSFQRNDTAAAASVNLDARTSQCFCMERYGRPGHLADLDETVS